GVLQTPGHCRAGDRAGPAADHNPGDVLVIPLLSHGFLFLRHGETDANVADRISGFTDDPLNARGVAQARAAATLLAGRPLAAIWHSPLVRAADTARAVAATTGAPLIPMPGLA